MTRPVLLALAVALALAACGPAEEPTTGSPTEASRGVSAGTASTGWFTDVTDASGVDFVHDAGISPEKHLPETMGGGLALVDADEDGALDLYFVQSGPVVATAARPPNRLYLGDGAGGFRDATASSGDAAHRGCGMGVAAGDTDGDGHVDLYVTNFGADVLLGGAGDGSFTDVTAAAGIQGERWTAGTTFFDADADGDLDLYVTAYVAIDPSQPSWCGRREEGWRSYCHPDNYPGLQDRFWRNEGAGRFRDATAAAGFADSHGKGLGAIALDADDDGDLDVYVANDSVENRLWSNEGDGTFSDLTLLSGTGVNVRGATEAGMGLAAGDVDGDQDLDLLVTNFDHESNTLYLSEGNGLFRDATLASGLEAPSRMPVGFGCLLEDFDQDGALDLAVANGHIIDNIELYDDAQRWRQHSQLFAGSGDGRFRALGAEAGDLVREPAIGRGLAAGDLDGDGDLDLVLTQCGGAARVFRNDAARGGAVTVVGAAAGSTVRVELDDGRELTRIAGPAPSYFNASHPDTHVGLGEARVTAVRVRGVDGAERRVVLEEPVATGTLDLNER